MAGSEPEKGDKVSWPWGGGAPGGTVAEKKTEGEVAITSKRGNKIKKNAEPDDPAVAIERSGNNVVKKASELNIEKKASGGGDSKKDSKDEGKGEKRKHDDSEEKNNDADPHVKNDEGKEVKAGGKGPTKKQKAEKAEKEKEKEKKEDTKKDEKKDEKQKETDGEKRKPGRPKGSGESKKGKKEPAPRKEGDLVSSRTRSRAK